MGGCTSKPSQEPNFSSNDFVDLSENKDSITLSNENNDEVSRNGDLRSKKEESGKKSPFFPFYSPSPAHSLFSKKSPGRSPANGSNNSTPSRFFKRPFPPPSPAKHIKAALARRHGSVKPNDGAIPEGSEFEGGLDKSFGFSKNFGNKYELGEEIGRGHFGYTCRAKFKKGELKGQEVAVKVIPKAKVCNLSMYFLFCLVISDCVVM